MFKSSALILALLLPAAALAQSTEGLYVGAAAGGNFAETLTSSHQTTKIDTDAGAVGLASLGWAFDNGVRAEIEGSYRTNDIGSISTKRVNTLLEPLSNSGGDSVNYAVMANLVYDIQFEPFGLPLRPYIGAGLGYGWLNLDNVRGNGRAAFVYPKSNPSGATPGFITVTQPDIVRFGTSGALAYQAIVGASLPLSLLNGLELAVEYRFFGMARTDIPVTRIATAGGDLVNGAAPSDFSRNGFEARNHALLIELRYAFNMI